VAAIEPTLFSGQAVEARGDLDRFILVRDHLPDEQIIQHLVSLNWFQVIFARGLTPTSDGEPAITLRRSRVSRECETNSWKRGIPGGKEPPQRQI